MRTTHASIHSFTFSDSFTLSLVSNLSSELICYSSSLCPIYEWPSTNWPLQVTRNDAKYFARHSGGFASTESKPFDSFPTNRIHVLRYGVKINGPRICGDSTPMLQMVQRIAAGCSKFMFIIQTKAKPLIFVEPKRVDGNSVAGSSQPNHKIPFVLNVLSAFFLLAQWRTLSLVNSFACWLLAKQWMRFRADWLLKRIHTHAKCGHKSPKELWITIIACSVVHGKGYPLNRLTHTIAPTQRHVCFHIFC